MHSGKENIYNNILKNHRNTLSPLVYSHSGDLGDIVWALPILKDKPGILSIKASHNLTRQVLTPEVYAPLLPLLKKQWYIKDIVPWNNDMVSVDLDWWRRSYTNDKNISQQQLEYVGVTYDPECMPWIDNIQPKKVAKYVINRTRRYNTFGGEDRWKKHLERNCIDPKECVFVGLDYEYQHFKEQIADIPWHKTNDLLEVAEIIAGSEIYLCNQSCPHAIAEGMKHPNIHLELYSGVVLTFDRPGVSYI